MIAAFTDRVLLPAYTMESERDIHRTFLHRFGIGSAPAEKSGAASSADADDVLFF
jgi:hypothetical protein